MFIILSGETMLGTPRLGIQAHALVQENPILPRSLTNQLYDQWGIFFHICFVEFSLDRFKIH